MPTKPKTVAEYLKSLPEDRRKAVKTIRDAVNRSLPKGYKEGIQYGMIGWFVPHSLYPAGYHCDPKQPVPFVSLASQKNHMSLYMSCVYGMAEERERLAENWRKAGKKLDMGKGCIRFKKLEDVPLDVVGTAIKRIPVGKFLAHYESVLMTGGKRKPSTKKAAKKKPAARKPVRKAAAKKATKKTAAKKSATRKKA